MQYAKDRAAKLYNISPKNIKPTVSPSRAIPTK